MRRIAAAAALIAALSAPSALAQEADLAITKLGPSQAPAGANVSYDITLLNLGPDPATMVTLTDAIPPGMTFVSATQTSGPPFLCSDPGAGNGGTVTCTIAALPANTTAELTFVFNIPPATAPNTTFINTATASTDTPDPGGENNSSIASTSTPPPPQGDLVISKNAPSAAGPNTDVPFTITVTNVGPDAAQNLSLQDTLPAGMTFVSLMQSGTTLSCTTPAFGQGGTVTCTAGSYPAGATTTLTLTAHVPSPAAAEYTNTATVSSTNDPNVEEGNSATTTVTVSALDVSVVKNGAGTVMGGANLTYTITVNNAGPDAAQGVNLRDTLPPGTTFVSLTQNNGPAATCSQQPGTFECIIALLPDDTSAEFSLTVNTGSTTSITNTATVTSEGFDTNLDNNDSSVTTTVTQSADLAVSKSGPPTATAGANVTYGITVTNSGPSNAASVTLTDVLPANTTFVSMTQTGGPAFSCGTTTCSIGLMPAGSTATFTLVLQVAPSAPNGSTISNMAQVTSTTSDPGPGANSSTSNATVVASSNVTVAKSGPPTVAAGADIGYSISVTNSGPSDAAAFSLTDTLPTNTTFVSAMQTGGPTFNCTTGQTITCTIAAFPAGSTATFSLVARVAPAAASGSTISNTAQTSTGPSSTTNATVFTSADVTVAKSGPPTVTAGRDATYTVTVGNSGPSDAANVTLTDPPPPNTTFVSATQTSGPPFSCTGTTCTIAVLPAASTATFSFVYRVSPSLPSGNTVSNTAQVSSTTPDPNPGNASSTPAAGVATSADRDITKSGPPTVTAGDDITYGITVSNFGPSDAASFSFSDPLPPNTTFVSLTQTTGPTFNCTTGPTVTCSIATFPLNASATFSLVVNVSPAATGTVDNTATTNASSPDPSPTNNSATSTTLVNPGPADVRIAKSVNGAMIATGASAVFTIVVTNDGPAIAGGVTVTDPLPPGTTLTSSSTTQGTCSGTTTVTCNLGLLAAGANATITLVVQLPQTPGPLTNTATVTIANADPNPANNASSAPFAVVLPTAVPTLSPLALALLAMAVAGIGFFGLRLR